MRKKRRISAETATVLELLLRDVARAWYGLEMLAEARLPSGTVYPILGRLESEGIIEGRWVLAQLPAGEQRRRRRLYTLAKDGASKAQAELSEFQLASGTQGSAFGLPAGAT